MNNHYKFFLIAGMNEADYLIATVIISNIINAIFFLSLLSFL